MSRTNSNNNNFFYKHSHFKVEIKEAIAGVQAGKKVSDLLVNSLILPALAVDLIKVGEETGQLGEMFTKVATIYEKETDEKLKRLLVFLEPVLILGLGALITVIILAVLLAMLSLNDLVI